MLEVRKQKAISRLCITQHLFRLNENNPIAMYDLATCYFYGWELHQDVHLILQYYHKAAMQKHAGACWYLTNYFIDIPASMSPTENINMAKAYVKLGIASVDIKEFDSPNYK